MGGGGRRPKGKREVRRRRLEVHFHLTTRPRAHARMKTEQECGGKVVELKINIARGEESRVIRFPRKAYPASASRRPATPPSSFAARERNPCFAVYHGKWPDFHTLRMFSRLRRQQGRISSRKTRIISAFFRSKKGRCWESGKPSSSRKAARDVDPLT